MKTALTIAGSDPTGGAGMQADLRTFRSLGVYGTGVIAALTAQNTQGVYEVFDVPPVFFSRQLDALLSDIPPDASKTGMLYSLENIKIVAEKVRLYAIKNFVVDPVTVSSGGTPLIENKALEAMQKYLFPLARTITPNIYEASLFTGINIQDDKDMKKAAMALKESGPESVIITGGHLKERALDLFFDGKEFLSLENEILDGEYHGTGCVFSSVITASLALGFDIKEAVVKAKDFVLSAMRSAVPIGKGMKMLNF